MSLRRHWLSLRALSYNKFIHLIVKSIANGDSMSRDKESHKAQLMMDALMAFNRKERYHVIRTAVTGGPMTLNDGFRQKLEKTLGLKIPDNAYVAMDYHMDWVSVANWISSQGQSVLTAKKKLKSNYPNKKAHPLFKGNQEDTDLLIAFRLEKRVVLIFVEAKADSKWKEAQIQSKAERLAIIFSKSDESLVDPYFVFMGPKKGKSQAAKQVSQLPSDAKWIFERGIDSSRIAYVEMKPTIQLYAPHRPGEKDESGNYLRLSVKKTCDFSPDDEQVPESDG